VKIDKYSSLVLCHEIFQCGGATRTSHHFDLPLYLSLSIPRSGASSALFTSLKNDERETLRAGHRRCNGTAPFPWARRVFGED